jgi:PEP-CTERM motif
MVFQRELKMFRDRSCAIFLLSVFTLAVMATPGYSTAITTYSSQATWLAATTGLLTDDFEGLAPANGTTSYPSGILQNGVRFIGLSGTTGVMDTAMLSFYNFGTGDAGFVSNGGQPIDVHITLPNPVTAFGINLFTNPSAVAYTVTALSSPFTVPTFTTPTPAFFGLTADSTFSTVDLHLGSGNNYAFFDNFQFGTAQDAGDPGQVPEPGTCLLIGTGLLGLAVVRRRSRRPRG